MTSEDAKLIKLDPTPNSSHGMKTSERLDEAVAQTIKNFNRKVVHIPCFNEIISFKSGNEIKQLRVIVGNFTHPSNLTHGERTGACMRIGGVGKTLFDFCLNNDYGFHIRFEDPQTGEYISRVSGFRNGNTVFLNELRETSNPDLYSNPDIVEACKATSDLIIQRAKGKEDKIDNVFVHRAYAMAADKTCPVINFQGRNIKKGLKHFYSDIVSYGLLLASSATPNPDISLYTSLPDYAPAREKVYEGRDKKKIKEMANRVNIIKKIIEGEEIENIGKVIENENDIEYGIVSQDFYIYIDADGILHEDIIKIDPRAITELDIARNKIHKHLEAKKLPDLNKNNEQKKEIPKQIEEEQREIPKQIEEEQREIIENLEEEPINIKI